MLTDISIMVWKEWRELLQFQGGKRSGMTGLLNHDGRFRHLYTHPVGRSVAGNRRATQPVGGYSPDFDRGDGSRFNCGRTRTAHA